MKPSSQATQSSEEMNVATIAEPEEIDALLERVRARRPDTTNVSYHVGCFERMVRETLDKSAENDAA